MCAQERATRYAQKFCKPKEVEREITEDDIEALFAKFNHR